MYSITVRDHIMIAHSFNGALFGPAQKLHGATYIIDVEFRAEKLTPEGVVIDIGKAHEILNDTLSPLKFQNLDELPEFKGTNTTTEAMAHYLFTVLAQRVKDGDLGAGSDQVRSMKVTLHESHVAWAAYEGELD